MVSNTGDWQNAYAVKHRGERRDLLTFFAAQLSLDNSIGAYNLFTKVDANGFSVADVYIDQTYINHTKVYYGALPSGENWTSDAVMQNTREEALEWYTSIADMGGRKCVGVIFEYRGGGTMINGGRYVQLTHYLKGYIPETAPTNIVYQAISDLKVWLNLVGSSMTSSVNTVINNKGAANPVPTFRQYTNSTSISGISTNPYGKRTYNMSTYQPIGGHTGGEVWGTSWLVIADYVQASKNTAQTTTNTAGGTEKTVYNLNNGERRVDYAITPTYTTGGIVAGATAGTVTITDTLPKYLTYVSDSSYIGGSYVYGSDSQTSHHTGGTAISPAVSVNSTTGETTLTWTLSQIATAHGEPMGKIYFSAIIGDENDPANDPGNNTSLLNSVTIRASTAVLPATASKSITVTNLADMTLTKSVLQDKIELGENVQYDMVIKNNSISNQTNLKALDVLPYNGDGRGTVFDGSYIVKQIVVQQTSAANVNLVLRTTNSTVVRTKNAYSSDLITGVSWTTPMFVTDGKTSTYYINAPLTGILLTSASFEAQSRAKITFILEPTGNSSGNKYTNNTTMYGTGFSAMVTAPVVSATVVQRSVSGLAWVDVNRNGIQDASELKISGLEVQLYKVTRDGSSAITSTDRVLMDIDGNAFGTVLTDTNGKYMFDRLPAGEYEVLFLGHGAVDISTWNLTTKDIRCTVSVDSRRYG